MRPPVRRVPVRVTRVPPVPIRVRTEDTGTADGGAASGDTASGTASGGEGAGSGASGEGETGEGGGSADWCHQYRRLHGHRVCRARTRPPRRFGTTRHRHVFGSTIMRTSPIVVQILASPPQPRSRAMSPLSTMKATCCAMCVSRESSLQHRRTARGLGTYKSPMVWVLRLPSRRGPHWSSGWVCIELTKR